jgi:hypothetical protein
VRARPVLLVLLVLLGLVVAVVALFLFVMAALYAEEHG